MAHKFSQQQIEIWHTKMQGLFGGNIKQKCLVDQKKSPVFFSTKFLNRLKTLGRTTMKFFWRKEHPWSRMTKVPAYSCLNFWDKRQGNHKSSNKVCQILWPSFCQVFVSQKNLLIFSTKKNETFFFFWKLSMFANAEAEMFMVLYHKSLLLELKTKKLSYFCACCFLLFNFRHFFLI